ncbi:hypothetical protein [Actinomadura fibrosa]|uniref:Zinc-ribbon domain-containing protein n=1 Tax=Actinomadura fibrosa TaxID=111802 RepID=A0ABW2XIW5_9ACTN|nr:hypothetical protein [Actinomadura fibrosa]
MTSDKTEARTPGQGSGLTDEQAGGRVVEHSVTRYLTAHASLYAPAGRRTMWWYAIRCPHCGAGHFGRLRDREAAETVRRTGCGRLVRLVVMRTYAPKVIR